MAAKDKVVVDIITNSDKSQKSILKYAAGVTAAVAAVAGMVKISKELLDAYSVQETAENNLMAAIKATGKESIISMDAMKDYASSLQDVTLYGDEAILSGQSLLQSLADLDQDGLQEVTPHVLDFATAMGIDLKSAMSLVGKTLGSSTNALGRYGIEIDMSGSKSEKLAELTQALTDKFGGMAEAAGNTSTGALVQMSNAVGDLKEELGQALASGLQPYVEGITNIIQGITGWLSKQNEVKEAINAVKEGTADGKQELIAMNQEYVQQVLNLEKLKSSQGLNISGMKDAVKIQEDYIAQLKVEIAAKQRAIALDEMGRKLTGESAERQAELDQARIEAEEKFQKILEDRKSPEQKHLENLQQEIDYWAQFRDITGVQEYLNDLVKERNELQAEMNTTTEETIDIVGEFHTRNIEGAEKANDIIRDQIDEVEELNQTYQDLANEGIGAFAVAFKDIGNGNEDLWGGFKEAGKDAISAVLEGLAKMALAEAAISLASFNFVKAGALTTAAAGAYAASGYVQTLATGGSFTTTGPTPILVGDNTSGQERVTVEPVGGNSGGNQTMILNIDGQQFMGWMQNQLDNGRLRVPRRILA